jgi:L-amino acid N-acyltransferase YncA
MKPQMSVVKRTVQRMYPHSATLDDRTMVTFRLMSNIDADRVLSFARSLPEDDLLFLRMDITKARVVTEWIENIEAGRTITVLAEADSDLAGYVSLHHNEVSWQRHIGEIRLQVSPRYRTRGLGRQLTEKIFVVAQDLRLRKVVAYMTPDQHHARATFERLGFQAEALLQDFVIDRAGWTRDLLVMTYDLMGLTPQVD